MITAPAAPPKCTAHTHKLTALLYRQNFVVGIAASVGVALLARAAARSSTRARLASSLRSMWGRGRHWHSHPQPGQLPQASFAAAAEEPGSAQSVALLNHMAAFSLATYISTKVLDLPRTKHRLNERQEQLEGLLQREQEEVPLSSRTRPALPTMTPPEVVPLTTSGVQEEWREERLVSNGGPGELLGKTRMCTPPPPPHPTPPHQTPPTLQSQVNTICPPTTPAPTRRRRCETSYLLLPQRW